MGHIALPQITVKRAETYEVFHRVHPHQHERNEHHRHPLGLRAQDQKRLADARLSEQRRDRDHPPIGPAQIRSSARVQPSPP